ncbi:MAG: AcrB/AcrD/AcrF family protein, partial [Proteobacteria bacterium]|nr:AcrB/AcrD/AcrF family protein [Pseudomonadota bacterium]
MPNHDENQGAFSQQRSTDHTEGRTQDLGIIAYFANNSVAANLVMGLLLIGGLISGIGLNAQVFPTLNPGIITVVVPYPGATPSEVEEAITRRVEEAVLGIEGVDEVRSSAAENVGTVTIELKDYVDDKEVKDDVESAVERIADFPPENAEQPEVERAQTVSDVMTLVVTSERDEMTLRKAAESLADQLLTLPSVTLVSLMGARDMEISVEVSEETLRQFNLSIADLATAINSSSLNLSAGELRTDAGNLLLRTNQKRLSGPEFADIVIRAEPDGSILRLGDVATIRDGFVDEDVIQEFNGQQSLLVKVEKSEAEDALFIAAQLKDFLSSYQAPQGTSVEIWDDQTNILEQRLSLLVRNGLLGFALVFLFLVVMLDLRLATWVAMGVPISFLGAFLFFAPFGVNINMISLFALIIVLGIVVDDAVVVGENIITEQEKYGLNSAATLRGVRGVFSPVTIGVLTTMAAFAPLLFVTGTFGQILGSVPIVVILVLSMSLLEVFFILPAHLSHGQSWSTGPLKSFQDSVSRKVMSFRDRFFLPGVSWAVQRRYFSLLCGIGLLVIAAATVSSGAVRFIFFPDLDSDTIRANLTFPVGTPFRTTERAANRIIEAAYKVNEDNNGTAFSAISATIGGASRASGGPGGGSAMTTASHLASMTITLQDEPLRTLSAGELGRQWRIATGEISWVESRSF